MVTFPPCKINIGLNVIAKRADGYHEIETCFYPVPWTDILEIIPASAFEFSHSGCLIPGKAEENLCLKAYHLLKNDFDLPPVRIHLHKIIPIGAGLGGGSSNATSTLQVLNSIFDIQLSASQQKQYASQLGSDCSFFVESKPMIGTGRGEVLEEATVNLKEKFIILVKPDVHISTAEAYAGVKPVAHLKGIKNIVENSDLANWKNLLKNDFEQSIFEKYPLIQEVKSKLYQQGAIYAGMSGSGSAVYGIFDRPININDQFPSMIYWSGILN